MDSLETERLIEVIESMCPSQRFTDDTPRVWARPLMDVSLADSLAAVGELSMKQDFISPKDILGEVKRVRDRRLVGVDELLYLVDEQYPSTPEGVRDATLAKRQARKRIGDGEPHEVVFGSPPPIESRRIVDESNVGRMLALKRPRDLPAAES